MINVSIIICTYNRFVNVEKNLKILNEECKSFINHVYVIDNASNLPKSFENDFVTVIYNRNIGGSGGFARGMYEAKKNKNTTHIMLMDDDISFDSSTLKSSINELKKIEVNDWLSFAMKTYEHPQKIYENTAFWSGIFIKSNFKNYAFNKSKPKKIKYNYASWWSIIMPISVIDKYGYPMPFFIKADDIEYGMRRKGEKIYFNNSISVFHEDFKKKYSPFLAYYCIRNYLVINSLHFKHNLLKSSLMFALRAYRALFAGKFIELEYIFLAMDDFFLGPIFFKETDLEANHKKIINFKSAKSFNLFYFLAAPFHIMVKLLLLLKNNKNLKKMYLKEYQYLTSKEFWMKQFNIN